MPRFALLQTRVARRLVLVFLVGALAPVSLLTLYSFTAVTGQLGDQSRDRLQQLSKNTGMSVLERLQDAELDLELAVRGASPGPALRSLRSVTVAEAGEPPPGLAPPRAASATEREHLASGGSILRLGGQGALEPAVWMGRLRDVADPGGALVWGRLDEEHLWGSADVYTDLPGIRGFCILLDLARRLHCADGERGSGPGAMVSAFRTSPADRGRGVFQYSVDGEGYVGSHWELFLRSRFQADPWTVLVSESEASVYAPLRRFVLLMPPVLLLGVMLVALLTNGLVRRTMEPLQRLTAGTRSIASKDFDTRVDVDSDNEFGELARAFNTMAARLGVQFRHLEASRAIDQAVLTATHSQGVVQALLAGFGSVVPHDRLAVLVLARDQASGSVHWVDPGDDEPRESGIVPSRADIALLGAGPGAPVRGADGELPAGLDAFVGGVRPALVLPLAVQDQVRGAVVVARERPFDRDEVERARQIVDQAAVALDEVQLLGELEEMSWGTLRALARAIDAKSRWTAGHSERVAHLSIVIAQEMGLSERQIGILERGGLLHDVGKIGIPAHVLDAVGPLTESERTVMEEHVLIGARILEPVRLYADSVPIVLHHHERWDGTGYPHGLAGTDIPLLARVLAVADTYDAMATLRPYRRAASPDAVVLEIATLSGRQFDPAVVAAFLRAVERGAHLRPDLSPAPEPSPEAAHG